METKEGKWVMHGLDFNDPLRIRTCEELILWIHEIGFVPLFRNKIPGFSVEEHVSDQFWWTGNIEQDPWEWRVLIARNEEIAYGKFFDNKAGFIAKEWFPYFANDRRDGYDFDARWEDGLADMRCKRIMDQFEYKSEYSSFALKEQAGFGKGLLKNFNGIVTQLQMQSYLVVKDFRQRISKKGQPFGMPVSIYVTPETLWGYDFVTSAYGEKPQQSRERIDSQIKKNFSA